MRLITSVTACALALLLVACASGDPKPQIPLMLDLTISAATTVNPGDQGQAAPIVVRVYELKTDNAFKVADYFSLQDRDKTVLTDDLVKRDEFQLRPGEHKTIRRIADATTTTVGVLAEYRDLPHAVWRAVYPLPTAPEKAWYRFSSPKLNLTINVDADAIRITDNTKK
ncbi:type VI secretion system lipoprotein TssJ [Trinickia violacea]|uniref:Type VI secretion system lipoprotein TssJ n=1 Tax=Trinickia violacea TaxID=2571746 RepID=A0A4P8J3E8_9BURK|nr:type VI secretion system lipoprotein TssJ [Trinickia violacea]QCP54384.1 type VI secretion system lipoprotein TssJ [Trinickia violacea]